MVLSFEAASVSDALFKADSTVVLFGLAIFDGVEFCVVIFTSAFEVVLFE